MPDKPQGSKAPNGSVTPGMSFKTRKAEDFLKHTSSEITADTNHGYFNTHTTYEKRSRECEHRFAHASVATVLRKVTSHLNTICNEPTAQAEVAI